MVRLPLVFPADLDSGDAPEIVAGVLAGAVDQQILFFIDEVFAVKLAQLELADKLNRIRRAGLFAQPAGDAAVEVEAEKLGIPAAGLVFGGLERDAIDRTGDGAEVACHTARAAVGIPRQNDAAAVARGEI